MAIRTRTIPLSELPSALNSEWADTSRRPYVSGGLAYVPVREGYPSSGTLGPRERYRGRGYYMVGRIAVVRGRRPTATEVRQIVDYQKPHGVLWIGSHSGICRIPETELLYGTSCDVLHRESGITYCIDPSKVMFSQGNRTEKARIAGLVRKGERVADMYAGIGYFSLPVAKAGGFVHAMEINPAAFGYLGKNILLNHLSGRITASCGDCRSHLNGSYDRVIMGHFGSLSALPDALAHVSSGSIIHFHSSGIRPPEIQGIVEQAGFRADISARTVKKTAPRAWHFVQDLVIE